MEFADKEEDNIFGDKRCGTQSETYKDIEDGSFDFDQQENEGEEADSLLKLGNLIVDKILEHFSTPLDAFISIDVNKDGYVSQVELANAFYHYLKLSPRSATQIFTLIDTVGFSYNC